MKMDKLIFLNIGWMSKYAGPKRDQISGGFKYLARHGYGHEMLNFKPYTGKMYGAAPIPSGTIRLERLGAPRGAHSVDGVLVAWVAKSRIVGWYTNATVFRHPQTPPKNSGRSYKGKPIRYYVTADASECTLLDPEARLLPVPRAREREHAMGRFTWFADGATNRAFRASVVKYVAAGGDISVRGNDKRGRKPGRRAYQVDPQQRAQIETAAIRLVTKHFESLHYEVNSVERDNLGWDLHAAHPATNVRLKLEVKGLSGTHISVELTPNEYKMMKKHKHDYRICVVTGCLDKNRRRSAVFAYNEGSRLWVDENDRSLQIKKIMAARLACS